MLRALARATAILAAAFLVSAAALVLDGLSDEVGQADVILVLGTRVLPDGTPSVRLRPRLQRALELYRAGMAPKVFVSSRIGPEGVDEAQAMKAWLVARGVPSSAVTEDNMGVNTRATAQNLEGWMRSSHLTRVIAISQYFHISRSRLALQQAGVPVIYTVHAQMFEPRDLFSLGRDTVGFYAYLLGART